MIKKTLYTAVRLLVFACAAFTAAVLIATALGVLFTALEWFTQSRTFAAAGVAGFAALVVTLVWFVRRRKQAGTPPGPKFWLGSVVTVGLAAAVGWGMSLFFVVPPLTVLCLRPLGSAAVPALFTGLDAPEAGPESQDALAERPEALLRELPRFEALVREKGRNGYGIKLISGLGPPAHAAAPTLIEALRRDLAVMNRDPSPFEFQKTGLFQDSEPWVALVKLGEPAVPTLVEALRTAGTSRERIALASILRLQGPSAAAAVPTLLELLKKSEADREDGDAYFGALVEIGPGAAAALPTLVVWAGDQKHPFSRSAVAALGSIGAAIKGTAIKGTAGSGAVTTLETVLNEKPLDTSGPGMPAESRAAQAIDALGRIGIDAASAAPRLAEIARTDEMLNWAASRALARIGPAGVEELKKLLADGHALVAAEAINEVGLKTPELVPALRAALADAKAPDDRVQLAWALYRNEGPSDDLLKTMAEAIAARDPRRDSAGFLAKNGVLAELDKLGPRAVVFAPVLTQLIEQTSLRDKVRMIKTLSRIEPGTDAPIGFIVREMRGGTIYQDDVFDAPWLTTIDPTGEKLIPVLVERLDDDRQRDHALRVLVAYGPKAHSALPAVVAANDRDALGERPYDAFLWNASPAAWIRYAYLPRYLAIPVLLVVCLLVECLWFRWRLVPKKPPAPDPRPVA